MIDIENLTDAQKIKAWDQLVRFLKVPLVEEKHKIVKQVLHTMMKGAVGIGLVFDKPKSEKSE